MIELAPRAEVVTVAYRSARWQPLRNHRKEKRGVTFLELIHAAPDARKREAHGRSWMMTEIGAKMQSERSHLFA